MKRLYTDDFWANLGEEIMKIPAEDIECSARAVLKAQEKWMKVLMGCLGHPDYGMRIGFHEGCWILTAGGNNDLGYEELIKHENWNEFINLILENGYSDFVEGDN